MTPEDLLISSLEAEISEVGISCTRNGDALFIESIALEILARAPLLQDGPLGRAVNVTFEARGQGETTDGIKVFQIGYGRTDVVAARDASRQWLRGVYPALANLFAGPDNRSDVDTAHMLVHDADTGQQFGWTVHLPPILTRAYGGISVPEHPQQSSVFRALFNIIHRQAAHQSLFWVECFAARYPGRKVDATCRKLNEDWEDGRDALMAWVMTWPYPGRGIISRRQFLLFQPTPI